MSDLSAVETVRQIRIVLVIIFAGVSNRPSDPTGPWMKAGSTADRLPDHVLQGSDLLTGRQDVDDDPEDLAVVW